ncbi:hypothetical protein EJ06DRAFT_239194 [Trichodelitschia bisporula]|uniref:Uncharacterized protein n=1 Tax=Trichodelitschia bisporula TaxID=703511 RepID=A0A6G1HKX8_9PEZI|nr:hypothetical protein EJ06DRAFT_239194 [Trichodelitschia bisporula]
MCHLLLEELAEAGDEPDYTKVLGIVIAAKTFDEVVNQWPTLDKRKQYTLMYIQGKGVELKADHPLPYAELGDPDEENLKDRYGWCQHEFEGKLHGVPMQCPYDRGVGHIAQFRSLFEEHEGGEYSISQPLSLKRERSPPRPILNPSSTPPTLDSTVVAQPVGENQAPPTRPPPGTLASAPLPASGAVPTVTEEPATDGGEEELIFISSASDSHRIGDHPTRPLAENVKVVAKDYKKVAEESGPEDIRAAEVRPSEPARQGDDRALLLAEGLKDVKKATRAKKKNRPTDSRTETTTTDPSPPGTENGGEATASTTTTSNDGKDKAAPPLASAPLPTSGTVPTQGQTPTVTEDPAKDRDWKDIARVEAEVSEMVRQGDDRPTPLREKLKGVKKATRATKAKVDADIRMEATRTANPSPLGTGNGREATVSTTATSNQGKGKAAPPPAPAPLPDSDTVPTQVQTPTVTENPAEDRDYEEIKSADALVSEMVRQGGNRASFSVECMKAVKVGHAKRAKMTADSRTDATRTTNPPSPGTGDGGVAIASTTTTSNEGKDSAVLLPARISGVQSALQPVGDHPRLIRLPTTEESAADSSKEATAASEPVFPGTGNSEEATTAPTGTTDEGKNPAKVPDETAADRGSEATVPKILLTGPENSAEVTGEVTEDITRSLTGTAEGQNSAVALEERVADCKAGASPPPTPLLLSPPPHHPPLTRPPPPPSPPLSPPKTRLCGSGNSAELTERVYKAITTIPSGPTNKGTGPATGTERTAADHDASESSPHGRGSVSDSLGEGGGEARAPDPTSAHLPGESLEITELMEGLLNRLSASRNDRHVKRGRV